MDISKNRHVLPTGVVTFLLTDVVGSTRIWQQSPHAARALARHAELIHAAIAEHDGVRPPDQGEGDSTLSAFARPGAAVAAALAAQRALLAETWPDGAAVAVRMSVHTGEAERSDNGNYGGLALIRAARLRAVARGGQVLISATTAALVADLLPDAATLADLGTAELAGFDRPERVHLLCHPSLPHEAPRLGTTALGDALPTWPTSLVGRERERREVGERLAKAHLVTITGAGGSGKTRLAHAIAQDHLEAHADGVVWVELARLNADAQVAAAVVSACGLIETPAASALEVLAQRLAKRDLLIVLDNCEHLLAACAELADALLRAAPGVRVLATAREPLGVAGEVMWRIPSLSVPAEDARALDHIESADAVRLFVERARASQPEFTLDRDSAPIVAAVCRRLDGIPLALELAAARVRALSLERLAAGLDDRFRLLTGGARTAVARQRTLLASVDWSYGLLDDVEQALFRRLAVFAAPFSLEAAEAVAADDELDRLDVLDVLARLVDKSLVLHGNDRYRMLETLRHFGLERAAERGELEQVRDRHLTWLRSRASAWAADREWLSARAETEIAAETPDLIAAIDWSIGRHAAATIDLLQPLGATWPMTLALSQARAVAARVLRPYPVGSPAWLETLAPIAGALTVAGDAATMSAASAALAGARADLSPLGRLQLETALCWGLAWLGRSEGIHGLERAIEDARAMGNRKAEALATFHLLMLTFSNDVNRTRRLADWLMRQTPPGSQFHVSLQQAIAFVAMCSGDLKSARALMTSYRHPAMAIGRAQFALLIGDRTPVQEALAQLDHAGEFGVFEGARDYCVGALAALDGDLATARDCFRAALRPGLGGRVARQELARAAAAIGDEAEWNAIQDETAREYADSDANLPLAFVDLGRALRARRDSPVEAEAHTHAALERLMRFGFRLFQVDALERLALIVGEVGRLDEAARLVGATRAFRTSVGYRRVYPSVAFDELCATLDPALVEEGAALSLEEAVEYARRGRGERSRPEHGWDSLTPTEARVVDLVAAGLPNKIIAEKLFVSVATVKTHLVHVYAKLDVRTRTELAARAARRANQ
ncbi:MAG TPA: LuxR C-terminal-related transcriptional regulator [Kofleriaceae bacterium]|nr:LuxR C-terminal-related transcriptional regulator [Kofleriaceae bacterium]